MFKLFILPLCILFIHSTKQAYCNEQKQNDYINNFLNKLLKSKKFEELADIIAEKAARKIQGLDKINGSQPQLRENNNNGNRSIKQIGSDDDSNETDEREESKPRSVINNKFHINPKVFKQLEPQEELSLNYKYLLKKSSFNTDGVGRNTVKNSEYNNKYDDHKKQINSENGDETHRNNKETIKNNDNEYMQNKQIANKKSQSDESLSILHPESNEDEENVEVTENYRSEKKSTNGRSEGQSTDEKSDSKDSEETMPRNQQQLKKQSTKNDLQTARQTNEIKENEEMTYEYSDEKPKPYKGNNEMTTHERNAHFKIKKNNYNPPHVTEVQVTIDKAVPRLTTTMTNQIRQEDGKQLIYEPAPEYHEYFEKLAKSKAPSIEKFLT